MLNIRQERFIWQNSIDLRHLIPFFVVYKIPILGHFILPFFVARFPELLPSTIRLSKQVLILLIIPILKANSGTTYIIVKAEGKVSVV